MDDMNIHCFIKMMPLILINLIDMMLLIFIHEAYSQMTVSLLSL
jgi:hypothetical protein